MLLVAMMAFAAVNAWSQDLFFTPKAGVNLANVAGDDYGKMKVGFVGGIEGMYMFTESVGLSLGVYYSQQGCKPEGNVSIVTFFGEDPLVKAAIDYVNIPIILQTYVYKGLAVKFGIQPSIKASEKWEGKTIGVKDSLVKGFDLGMPVGISYEFYNIVIDARYNWGFLNIFKDSDLKAKNSVFQFTLGYKFGV